MDFKVLTLDLPRFAEACNRLERVVTDGDFDPQMAIYVPSKGSKMRQFMFTQTAGVEIEIIRPSKGRMLKSVSQILKRLPSKLVDRIRVAEAHFLVKRRSHMHTAKLRLPEISSGVSRVIVIDDAVDSGATLHKVMTELQAVYPTVTFKSAVLTVTSPAPIYRPDYTLFDNQTLIRTPWSIDMKK